MSQVKDRIPEGWDETALQKLTLKIGSGATPRGGAGAYKEQGISLIRSQNILDFDFSYSGLAFIDENQAKKLSNVTLEKNDVLINITGDSVARVCMVPLKVLPARVNQHVAILRPNTTKLDNHFLLYYLLNPNFKRFLLQLASDGATRNALTKSNLENLLIKAPKDLNEQKSIAKVLTAFDNKIENLRTQNETLELIAQTIFTEWFGKYQIGDELPTDYKITTLDEILSLQGGFVHNTKLEGPTISKIAKMGVVSGLSLFKRKSVINYSEKIDSKYKLEANDLIVCTRDVTQDRLIIGNVALVPKDLAEFGLYSGSNTWIIKSDYNKYFLFLLFRSKNFRHHIIKSSKGSTIIMITKDSFLNCETIMPNETDYNKIVNTISPFFYKIQLIASEIQTLSTARDTLLPKLMRGQLRVNGFKN